jgi:phosphopantothenoylcysteine decarboxylase/phosphopantothenate--cysteine ligase
MNCIVTAGPTHENLDEVRRLTNFSTGRLGAELAAFLAARGHAVRLLLGQQATWRREIPGVAIEEFGTTADLGRRFELLSVGIVHAVFHAAAVSDFSFGKVWMRLPDGTLEEIHSAKIPTRGGNLLAELAPTPKLIARLRDWYPQARLVGWKYEVEGDQAGVIRLASRQIHDCRTDACVANGRAYGEGFGFVTADGSCRHLTERQALYAALDEFLMGSGTGR